ncbi:MAG: acyl-CoA dehydrogenase family protein, partial [Nitrospinota bacterium]
MDFELTEEHLSIQKEIRAFARERIAPQADANDCQERFPRDIVDGLAERGFLGGPIPREWGGRGYDFISHAIVAEEIGRVDTSMRSFYSVHCSLVSLPILRFGSEDQKRRYLPALARGEVTFCLGYTEPEAGSDLASLQTRAVADGDDYVISGRKV